jgi:DNA topoisomerase-1
MTVLIIVESNKKAQKITKFLSNEKTTYICTASYGHIIDLKKTEMSIDFSNWTGIYENINQKSINNIKELSKNCEYILLASDDDDEGHFIAKSISDIISNKIKKYRIIFREITKSAILNAIERKHDIDLNRVNCQIARRFADRIFGYKLSPLLWNNFNQNTLSAGRCQSPILAMIVKKTDEINNPVINQTNKIKADFVDNILNSIYIGNSLIKDINIEDYYKISYDIKETLQNPPPPYITSSIQMDCSSILNIPSKKCMEMLQSLYEAGNITYHRTSSISVSNSFKKQAQEYIISNYGSEYSKPRNYIFGENTAAHECIRVTDINIKEVDNNPVYKLIWKRSIASQFSSAIFDQYDIKLKNKDDIFIVTKKKLKFTGFLILDNKQIDKEVIDIPKKSKIKKLYSEASIEKLSLYNDTTIIKQMEKSGIGRPSTFATILNNLFNKGYITYGSNPVKKIKCLEYERNLDKVIEKEISLDLYTKGNNKMILNTNIGKNIIKYLNEVATYIIQEETTKIMEKQIDLIGEGKTDYKNMLNHFNEEIDKSIEVARNIKKAVEKNKIIKTKYGKCILTIDGKYIGIDGFLNQFKKTNLNDKEIDFLISLPKKIENESYLYNGRYGLYIKKNNENISLSKDKLKEIYSRI